MDGQVRNPIAQRYTVTAFLQAFRRSVRPHRSTGIRGCKGNIRLRCGGRSPFAAPLLSTFRIDARTARKSHQQAARAILLWHTNRMSCYRRDRGGPSHRLRWIWLAAALSLTACAQAQQWGAVQPAPQKAAQPGGKVDLHLDPGCPLGATVQQGLNVVEESCRPSPRTNPPGPVGTSKP